VRAAIEAASLVCARVQESAVNEQSWLEAN
jgi:hypothetical protein